MLVVPSLPMADHQDNHLILAQASEHIVQFFDGGLVHDQLRNTQNMTILGMGFARTVHFTYVFEDSRFRRLYTPQFFRLVEGDVD